MFEYKTLHAVGDAEVMVDEGGCRMLSSRGQVSSDTDHAFRKGGQ